MNAPLRHTPAQTAPGAFYLVLNDYGPKLGRAFVERDPVESDWAQTISALAKLEWSRPVQVVEVNLADCTSRDVTAMAFDSAREVRWQANLPPIEFGC